jgi:queuine tRNA-ribosyltransferase
MEEGCDCMACRQYSRAFLHPIVAKGLPFAANLVTHHNVAYMQRLARQMREAIAAGRYPDFVREFVAAHYPRPADIPEWVREGCRLAGIRLGGEEEPAAGGPDGEPAAPCAGG